MPGATSITAAGAGGAMCGNVSGADVVRGKLGLICITWVMTCRPLIVNFAAPAC